MVMVRISRVIFQESGGDYHVYRGERKPVAEVPDVFVTISEDDWMDGSITCPDCSNPLAKETDDYDGETGELDCGTCGSVFAAST